MKKLLLFAIPLLAAGSAASAQAPAGFRLEPIAGYDRLKADFTGTGKQTVGGVFYGAGAGFDFPMGGMSLGIDAEATMATTDTDTTLGEFELGRDLYVGGRITGAIGENANVYAKAGYTNLRLRFEPTLATTVSDLEGNGDGVRGALGVQIGDADSAAHYGFELRYSDYEGGVSRQQAAVVLGIRF